MADAIDRSEIRCRLKRIRGKNVQRRESSYKSGWEDAIQMALHAAEACESLETTTITRCKDCVNATERNTTLPYCIIHNRTRDPEDYCNYGARDFEG